VHQSTNNDKIDNYAENVGFCGYRSAASRSLGIFFNEYNSFRGETTLTVTAALRICGKCKH